MLVFAFHVFHLGIESQFCCLNSLTTKTESACPSCMQLSHFHFLFGGDYDNLT